MADGRSHKALVESSTLSPGTLGGQMAKMISRAGYWGTCCSSKCGYCDRWPRFNKTAMRQKERKQWRKEWQE